VAEYVDLVRAGAGMPSLGESLRGRIFFGSEALVKRLQDEAVDRLIIPERPLAQRKPLARPLCEYRDTSIDESAQYRTAEQGTAW